MNKTILIIGAGWYGCHIGLLLKRYDIDFIIYEKEKEIFMGSSNRNQNRLHIGFHYPRSYKTRKLCEDGYYRFLSKYGHFIEPIKNNYYCIANDSIIDFETYKIIMEGKGVEVKTKHIQNVQGILNTGELFIDNEKIKLFFELELNEHIRTNINVNNIEKLKNKFKYIINCTNNILNTNNNFYFEKTLSLIYKKIKNQKEINSYTIMDGPFCSLFPFDICNKLYTLTDVEDTPVYKSFHISDIQRHKINDFIERRERMENKIKYYFPNFLNEYKYDGYYTSLKVKKKSKSDERDCYINKKDNIINVFCDKILGIFIFEDYIKNLLNINCFC
jgi:hypothetical protein